MSIYYELRMTGTLSFKDKNDNISIKIKEFIKQQQTLLDNNSRPTDYITLEVTGKELFENSYIDKYYKDFFSEKNYDRVYEFTLWNRFVDNDLAIVIQDVDEDTYKIDWCIGHKNMDDRMEFFTLMLVPLMDSEFKLVFYDEQNTYKLNQIKQSLDRYETDDVTGVCIYGIMNEVERLGEDAEIDKELEWLHDGLDDTYDIKE